MKNTLCREGPKIVIIISTALIAVCVGMQGILRLTLFFEEDKEGKCHLELHHGVLSRKYLQLKMVCKHQGNQIICFWYQAWDCPVPTGGGDQWGWVGCRLWCDMALLGLVLPLSVCGHAWCNCSLLLVLLCPTMTFSSLKRWVSLNCDDWGISPILRTEGLLDQTHPCKHPRSTGCSRAGRSANVTWLCCTLEKVNLVLHLSYCNQHWPPHNAQESWTCL